MKIRAKIDLPIYNRDGERLPEFSVRKGRDYDIIRQVTHSIYVVRNEQDTKELILVPAEGYLIR